jgi:DNA invertase Pin-like site-specific DNA recombinase
MIAPEASAALREAHEEFQRVRGRVWVERVRAGLEYRRAMRTIDEGVAGARLRRDDLVRDAVADGASYREVARALGLSHSRVQQIVNASRAVPPDDAGPPR